MAVLALLLALSVGAEPLRVGGDVKAPEIIKRVEPRYPKVEGPHEYGILVLEAVITRGGVVRDIRIVRGEDNAFVRAIIGAMRQWRFKPATRKGKAVEVYYNVTVNHVPRSVRKR